MPEGEECPNCRLRPGGLIEVDPSGRCNRCGKMAVAPEDSVDWGGASSLAIEVYYAAMHTEPRYVGAKLDEILKRAIEADRKMRGH